MPAYVDAAGLRDRLAPTGETAGTAAELADPQLDEAITDAQAEVDGRLAGRYAVPFTVPPQLVVSITGDIAAYLATLVDRRGDPLPPGDPVALRYARAETLLGRIADGTLDLPTDPPTTEAGARPTANSTPSLFGASNYLRTVPLPDVAPAQVYDPGYIPPPFGM